MITDQRIGSSHVQVPGSDGRKGYGGACFPKDTNAFSKFAEGDFSILDLIIEENNKYRSEYQLDEEKNKMLFTLMVKCDILYLNSEI